MNSHELFIIIILKSQIVIIFNTNYNFEDGLEAYGSIFDPETHPLLLDCMKNIIHNN